MTEITLIANAMTVLGESPCWDEREERLYWIGLLDGLIFRTTAKGDEVSIRRFPTPLSSYALRADGGAILTSGTHVYLYDFDSDERTLLHDAGAGPSMAGNDGKVDRQGRFVFGVYDRRVRLQSIDLLDEIEPAGGWYRVDPDHSVHRIAESFGITNGPCFSRDGSTLYCMDSWARRIYAYAYDVASGEASHRRIHTQFEDTPGADEPARPDGATVDEEGYLWVAAVYGGEIRRYAPDGTLDRRVPVPVRKPTSIAFGGTDMDVLYVTSMVNRGPAIDGAPTEGPLPGSVFAVRGLGVHGTPEHRYLG